MPDEISKVFDAALRRGLEHQGDRQEARRHQRDVEDGRRLLPRVRGDASGGGGEERFYVTRAELIGLVDEALRARGIS